MIVTVPEGVPEFPPPPPVEAPPPQLVIHAKLRIRSAKMGTSRRLELRAATTNEARRSSANAKRTRRFRRGSDGVLHIVGVASGLNAELAVVVTVTMKAVAVVPFIVTEVGETEHVDFARASVQASVTVPLKPLTGAT